MSTTNPLTSFDEDNLPIPEAQTSGFVTMTYKRIHTGGKLADVNVDIYPPSSIASRPDVQQSVPAVVYFHGGGLICGNKQSWLPTWLQERVAAAGYAFISPDYQLIPQATAYDILTDIHDFMAFISSVEINYPPSNTTTGAPPLSESQAPRFKIDSTNIVVVGSSSTSICAYFTAMYCVSPKPKAILVIYGMGGNFLIPHYLSLKTKPFFFRKELLDLNDYLPYLHSTHWPSGTLDQAPLQPIVESPLLYHPDFPTKPAHPRMFVPRLYLQLGNYLDYYTGSFENGGLSAQLRKALGLEGISQDALPIWKSDDELRSLIPPSLLDIFPQFGVTKEWPPTMFVHGTCDTVYPIEESRSMAKKLKAAGVEVQMCEVEGRDHAFDYRPKAEEESGYVFISVMDFLKRHLGIRD